MTSAARAAGTRFETETLAYLREAGVDAERLAKAGSKDEGDIVARTEDAAYVMELKARREKTSALSLGSWLGEALVEAQHWQAARSYSGLVIPVLVVKRPSHAIGKSFVIMQLEDFIK